jgi:hypothetical protein
MPQCWPSVSGAVEGQDSILLDVGVAARVSGEPERKVSQPLPNHHRRIVTPDSTRHATPPWFAVYLY